MIFVLPLIIMGKAHSSKHYDLPHPASLTIVPGITGTTDCTFSLFHPCPRVSSRHEAGSQHFLCRAARLVTSAFASKHAPAYVGNNAATAGSAANIS